MFDWEDDCLATLDLLYELFLGFFFLHFLQVVPIPDFNDGSRNSDTALNFLQDLHFFFSFL